MKREEKNQQMRRRIMDSALTEFSKKGMEPVRSIPSAAPRRFPKESCTIILIQRMGCSGLCNGVFYPSYGIYER